MIALLAFSPDGGALVHAAKTDTPSDQIEAGRNAAMIWNAESQSRAVELLTAAADSSSLLPTEKFELLVMAARCELRLGNRDSSVSILVRAAKIAIAAQDFRRSASAYGLIAASYFSAGKVAQGRDFLSKAKNIFAGESARVLIAEAEYLRYGRNFSGSIQNYRRAAEISSASGDRQGEAECLLEIGFDLMASGSPKASIEILKDLQRKWIEIGDPRGQALTNIALGHSFSALSYNKEAIDSYRLAETGFPDGIDSESRASLHAGLSNVLEQVGDYQTAADQRKRAIELFEMEDNEYGVLISLPRLARVTEMLGHSEEAIEMYRRANDLARALGDEYSLNLNRIWMADSLIRRNELKFAEAEIDIALTYFKQKNNLREIALIERLAGVMRYQTGNRDVSKAAFQRSLAIMNRIQDSLTASDVEYRLARISLDAGDFGEAQRLIDSSLRRSSATYSELSNSIVQRSFLANISARYEVLLRLRFDGRSSDSEVDLPGRALSEIESMRARTIFESISVKTSGPTEASDPAFTEAAALKSNLNSQKDLLTDLLSSGASVNDIEKVEHQVRLLEHELEEISAKLKEANPAYSLIKNLPPFVLSDFQSGVLGEDEVFLELFLGKDQSYLWHVGKNEFEAFVLPPREKIETKIDALRDLLDARKPIEGESFQALQVRVADADAKYAPIARELSNMILGPVAEKLAGKRLIVVPDGKLHYFPISALPMPNAPSDDPILLTNEVIYQPSAQTYTLLKTLRGSDKKVQNTKDILVFSDPVFNTSDERLSGLKPAEKVESRSSSFRLVESFSSLSRLPASGEEAATISGIIGGSTDVVSGFDATRERLLNTNLADYRVIHLATHGFVDADRPELSSIILSRFDQAGNPIDESIRMQDIYAMKLNADLVVLSACKTGTGKEIKGEGVMGLNTAFLQAGARSVVSTLWQVEDNAANHLMKEFYSQMVSGGMAPSAALRAAQIKLYQDPQFRSPFFWAAFTIQGDANTTPHFTRGYARSTVAAGAFAIIVILGFLIWKRRSVQRTSKL